MEPWGLELGNREGWLVVRHAISRPMTHDPPVPKPSCCQQTNKQTKKEFKPERSYTKIKPSRPSIAPLTLSGRV